MRTLLIGFLSLATVLITVPKPAQALTCADVFATMGRTIAPDKGGERPLLPTGAKVLDCPPETLMQFVYDHTAARRATDVTDPKDLIGTWVSDNVLGMLAGVFIPVYEVLVIEEGPDPSVLNVTQKLIRGLDPAEWYAEPIGMTPDIDVASAGRIATYGEHIVRLAKPGQIEPRRVRYFDFPIESDRGTGLMMKTQYMSFEVIRPIRARSDGDRLVFAVFDRFAPKSERTMTFRRRGADLPEMALLIALMGEVSMSKFHCFLEAMDRPTAAFTNALNGITAKAFFAGLRAAARLAEDRDAMLKAMRATKGGPTQAQRDRAKASIDAQIKMMDEPPMQALRRQIETKQPFGCPDLF